MSRTLNWKWIREMLFWRRYERTMRKAGYRYTETDWEIIRGGRYDERIVDVQIHRNGKGVWTRLGKDSV